MADLRGQGQGRHPQGRQRPEARRDQHGLRSRKEALRFREAHPAEPRPGEGRDQRGRGYGQRGHLQGHEVQRRRGHHAAFRGRRGAQGAGRHHRGKGRFRHRPLRRGRHHGRAHRGFLRRARGLRRLAESRRGREEGHFPVWGRHRRSPRRVRGRARQGGRLLHALQADPLRRRRVRRCGRVGRARGRHQRQEPRDAVGGDRLLSTGASHEGRRPSVRRHQSRLAGRFRRRQGAGARRGLPEGAGHHRGAVGGCARRLRRLQGLDGRQEGRGR